MNEIVGNGTTIYFEKQGNNDYAYGATEASKNTGKQDNKSIFDKRSASE